MKCLEKDPTHSEHWLALLVVVSESLEMKGRKGKNEMYQSLDYSTSNMWGPWPDPSANWSP